MKRKADGLQPRNQRTAFNRQPARLLLLDLQSALLDTQTINNLCDAMENVFAMVTSMNGPNRIPFLGLTLLHSVPEVIFPLQPLRGNFTRLVSSLNELRRNQKHCDVAMDTTCNLLGEAIKDGLAMFRRQAQGLLQTAGYWAQLELTIITGHEVTKFTKTLKSLTKQLDVDGLKKIEVLALSREDLIGISERPPTITSQSSDVSDPESNDDGDDAGIVDFTTIDNSVLCIESYMMGWLHDGGTDQEHLHITFPGDDDTQEELTLKCDIQERLLNPANLPFNNYFYLGMEGGTGKLQPSGRGGTHTTINIHKLNVVNKIPADSVCESVLFGMPLVLRATSCWKIDWDELEINQQHFLALCQLLTQKSEVLLAQLSVPQTPTQPGFRYTTQPPCPSGLFLLLPSQKGSLLVKSIASRELVMPLGVSGLEQTTDAGLQHVQQTLDRVAPLESYNPLLTSSGLHSSLVAQLTKNLSGNQSRQRPTPGKPVSATKTTQQKSLHERKPIIAGPPGTTGKTAFTSAKWAMERAQDYRTSSGREFYSKGPENMDDFPTQL